ncbi:YqgE/AlgH family protein [Kaarinaea lacus]
MVLVFFLAAMLVCVNVGVAAEPDNVPKNPGHSINKGIFLVATEQLAHSSFKETVILITHHSERGATGLAINRPSEYQLNEVFPEEEKFRLHREEVFLGGPVHTNSVFVLMRTKRPHANMYNIAKDLYFSAGVNALVHGLDNISSGEHARAYVGYSGWAPGQLEHEIHRGDWIVVHADPDIVFDQDHRSIWKKLLKSWSGQWI